MRPDERLSDGIPALFARKREWHRREGQRPIEEKVRILLELQRQELGLLARQRSLRSWERPWDITP